MAVAGQALASRPRPGDSAPALSRLETRWLVAVVVAAVMILLGATMWLSNSYERAETLERVQRDTAAAAAGIRTRLIETEQALLLLAAELGSARPRADFASAAQRILDDNPALLRIERHLPGGKLVEWVEGPPPRPRIGYVRGDRLRFEAQIALRAARSAERIAYSKPYYLTISGSTGFSVIELAVESPGEPTDPLIAVYSMARILDTLAPAAFVAANEVRLTEVDGRLIATSPRSAKGAGVFVASKPLELPGASVLLVADSARGAPPLIPNLLGAMLLAVTVALGASALLLWRDMRLRLRAERALRHQHAFRKAMEDSLVTGLRARDNDGRITYVNPAFCKMTGFEADELEGALPPLPYWAPEAHDEYQRRQSELVASSGNAAGIETVFMRKSGERFPVLVFESPLIDEAGHQTGWMGSILDVSEQRHAEELSRRQQEKLQANARLATLGEMASALSHELNQPLAAITSYASACENLLARGERDSIGHALERIRAQAERAGQVIRSVAAFVRRRKLHRQQVPVAEMFVELEPLIGLQAKKAGVRVSWRASRDCVVFGDRTMLELVILNLTRNAIDAMADTAPASRQLEMDASVVVDAGGEPRVEIAVLDRGPGVDAEAIAHLFTPFFSTKADGIGIGLSLCRSVAERHGGRLSYEPREGGGARFCLRLPNSRTPADE